MKMPRKTFEQLAEIIEAKAEAMGGWHKLKAIYLLGDFPRSDKVTDLWKRFRWDMFYAARPHSFTELSDGLMDLNDSHIDTALRRIVPDPHKPQIKILTPQWRDMRGVQLKVEPADIQIVFEKLARRNNLVPAPGDYLTDGRRIARITRESLQPTSNGSWYLLEQGGDFSGGLDNPIRYAKLEPAGERLAKFWQFSYHGAGAGRGWRFKVPVPVWQVKEEVK